MAYVNMKEMLLKAREERYAIPNFDCFNAEMFLGVLEAAEEKNASVIIAYANPFEDMVPMEHFAPFVIRAAEKAGVDVALHLDHAENIEYIKKAVDNGFTSVMLDASAYPFEENMKRTKEVVDFCSKYNVSVESELGHVGGLEGVHDACDNYDDGEDGYTNVEQAVEFVEKTGIDALAVAIGTVHGVYKKEPKLSFERLTELREALPVPLVLHGGSGLSDDDFKKAINLGISKLNIYTDLNLAATKAIKELLDKGKILCDFSPSVKAAVKAEAIKKIELFGCAGKN